MLKKLLPIIMLGLTASIANATVLINVPGIGATGQSSASTVEGKVKELRNRYGVKSIMQVFRMAPLLFSARVLLRP